jgi:NSS family neurotransmitter:Na+ symporter
MSEKVLFRSKIGLIAATVGSAVGLGTVWRFPAQVQANGGAAFLLIYIICAFLLGVPVMLSEFAMGREGGSDAVGTYRKLAPGTRWWIVGAAAVLVSFMILCFYMVVGGWTFEYLIESFGSNMYPDTAVDSGHFTQCMQQYVMTGYAPLFYTLAFVAINVIVLLGGVQKGIERMSNIMMPLLFILLAVFCVTTLTLPDAMSGVEFFLNPDFSKITPGVCISALGQALFSLSLGMGILITYAAYYPADTRLTRTSITVVSMTLMIAMLMGLIIFPAVASFKLADHGLSGTTLVFVTLPEVFAMLPASRLWSVLFFLLLMVAALTSTVSIAEVSVKFMQDRFGMSRKKATWCVLLPIFPLSGVCALSFGVLSDFTICGKVIFDALDAFTNIYMLPLVALAGCIYAGWFAEKGLLRRQLSNNGTLRMRITTFLIFMLKWFAPVAILAIFIFGILN